MKSKDEKEIKLGFSESKKKYGIEIGKNEKVTEETYIEMAEGKGGEEVE